MSRTREFSELATAYDSGGGFGFRNRLINSDMRIDQRNNGASVTYPGGGNVGGELVVVDRWAGNSTGSTRFSMQRSTTAPTGFTNSLLITTTTAGSPASGDFCYFVQHIEGFNTADLGFGSASAQAVTISFWIRSSLTGTFGASINNSVPNRRYPFSFTISAANTWEYKTVTIPGDITGTWLTDNGRGISLSFNLGSGSSNKGTANAWTSAIALAPSGTVDLVATAGATLNITGVQLEAGSVATPFERRPYGTELALCMRYFQRTDTAQGLRFGVQASTSAAEYHFAFPVEMRAGPSLSFASLANFSLYSWAAAASRVPTSMTIAFSQTRKCAVQTAWVNVMASAGVGTSMDANNGDFLSFSAEL